MNDPTQMAVLSGFGLVGLIKGRKEDEGRKRARCSCGIEPVVYRPTRYVGELVKRIGAA